MDSIDPACLSETQRFVEASITHCHSQIEGLGSRRATNVAACFHAAEHGSGTEATIKPGDAVRIRGIRRVADIIMAIALSPANPSTDTIAAEKIGPDRDALEPTCETKHEDKLNKNRHDRARAMEKVASGDGPNAK